MSAPTDIASSQWAAFAVQVRDLTRRAEARTARGDEQDRQIEAMKRGVSDWSGVPIAAHRADFLTRRA